MTTQLDLRELAIDRQQPPKVKRRRKHLISRYLLPGIVILGFLGMLGWAARDQFLPAKSVTVVPVVVTRAEVQQSGTPLFQAAGWIEPRPTPINVAALTEGVVEELLVVEGQEVQAAESIARLVDIDARLALKQAENTLNLREAEHESAEATLKAAQLRFDNPAHLDALLAEAKSLLAQTETEIAKLPYLTRAAQAKADYTKQSLERSRAAGGAVAARTVDLAESEQARALANLKELQQRGPQLEREADALRAKVRAVETQRELLIEESRKLAEAKAAVKIAAARLEQAKLAVETARLALERTVVRAPVSGRILELVAHPGTRVMGLESSAGQSSSTVVTMYDPTSLQVRADVRLEDVPMIQIGQPVTIETASSKEPLQGKVLQATSSANVQKNTLEVKVAIEAPPTTIRPNMLVTATFLAPSTPEGDSDNSERKRLLVPRQLVESTGDSHTIWVAETGAIARQRTVQLGKAGTEDLVEVVEGLNLTDKLISGGREGLADGDRIIITREAA